MTHVRQSVVSVIIFCHFCRHDPADAEKRGWFGYILNEPGGVILIKKLPAYQRHDCSDCVKISDFCQVVSL